MRVPDEERLQRLDADTGDVGRTAIGLATAMSRLRSRLREEAGMYRVGLSIAQIALLARLIMEGPATAAQLANAEHVSQQAIAQSLTTLKADGLVAAAPDPSDRRKTLLSATDAGRALYDGLHESRENWLIRAVETTLTDDERRVLVEATALLERLAGVDLNAAAMPTAIDK